MDFPKIYSLLGLCLAYFNVYVEDLSQEKIGLNEHVPVIRKYPSNDYYWRQILWQEKKLSSRTYTINYKGCLTSEK